ncbi:MAG: GMC family oxidoreductase N-terminal domain-containing protein, partial [Myxococcaceae bacterium]
MSAGRIYTGDEIQNDVEVSCDVCIVGSGSGGAVLAHELVLKGLNVVMLEEGGYHTRRDFNLTEAFAFPNLYQELGNRSTDDLAITILQGRSVGGGTTVNWCSTFRTPDRILAAWKDVHGVEGITKEALSPHWDAIEKRLHVKEWPLELVNPNNKVLWDGLGKLGYDRGLIRRNVNGCANIGYCGMGCPIDAKQSMLVTYIPDAVEKGLTLYANASAREIVWSGRKVSAVKARVLHDDKDTAHAITVKPKVLVVSGGAINSPALLLRSDLNGNGRVGKRFFIHPVVVMSALFNERIDPFSGAPQSVYSHHFVDRGADKIGFFLEVPPVHPMLGATSLVGFGEAHQAALDQLPYTNAMIAITVDGLLPGDEGGSISLRSKTDRRFKIEYPLGEANWEAFKFANKEMAKLQFAAGAKQVMSMHTPPVVMSSPDEVDKLDSASWERLRTRLFSAHQMGGDRKS